MGIWGYSVNQPPPRYGFVGPASLSGWFSWSLAPIGDHGPVVIRLIEAR